MSNGFPWARPRYELALLALVAIAALLPVYTVNAQDQSRLCLTQALVHGRVSNDECLATSVDKASFGGHLYSDKAPGLSVLELPGAELLRLQPVGGLEGRDARTWGVRLLANGLVFLLGAFLVGRIAEGLAPGYGGGALVAFALGTLAAPLAASNFEHLSAGTVALAAFLLAWRRRYLPSGLLAGAALLIEYQAAAIVAALAVYAVWRERRALAPFAAGVAPGVALLLAYDTAAFGSPWHLSYRYVAVEEQSLGFFGISWPRLHSVNEVLFGYGGLLLVSPVVAAAAVGLWLLGRRYPREALVCAVVTAFYFVLVCGYFLPYGGVSPGPRFFAAALPFLAVGLGPVFARFPRTTSALTAVSVVGTLGLMLVWTANEHLHQTIWGELARVAVQGRSSRLVRHLMVDNALGWTRLGSGIGLAVIAAAAAAALVLGLLPGRLHVRDAVRRHPWRIGVAAAVAAAVLVVVAERGATSTIDLHTSIHGTAQAAFPGDEVDLAVTVENPTGHLFRDVALTIELPEGMQLLGKPFYERGSGCTGTTTLSCDLDFLEAGTGTNVRLGVRIVPAAEAKLEVRARATSEGVPGDEASYVVRTGSA